MYWIWLIFTSPNEYLLDRDLGLVAKGTDWHMIRYDPYFYSRYTTAVYDQDLFTGFPCQLRNLGNSWEFDLDHSQPWIGCKSVKYVEWWGIDTKICNQENNNKIIQTFFEKKWKSRECCFWKVVATCSFDWEICDTEAKMPTIRKTMKTTIRKTLNIWLGNSWGWRSDKLENGFSMCQPCLCSRNTTALW